MHAGLMEKDLSWRPKAALIHGDFFHSHFSRPRHLNKSIEKIKNQQSKRNTSTVYFCSDCITFRIMVAQAPNERSTRWALAELKTVESPPPFA